MTRTTYSPVEDGASVANIIATFTRGSTDDYVTGRAWYAVANGLAEGIGHGDRTVGAGILAALSPNIGWPLNLRLAQRLSRSRRFTAGHYKVCLGKARRIHKGEPIWSVLRGPKESAFACNIAHGAACTHELRCVTVDRHALAIAFGRVLTDIERSKLLGRVNTYRVVAQLYRDAASLLRVDVHALQAVTWVTWRREKGITE